MGLELATLAYKPSALAIELNSSKAIAGKELSLSGWCIASLYIYRLSAVVDFSSEKYSDSTGNWCYFLFEQRWSKFHNSETMHCVSHFISHTNRRLRNRWRTKDSLILM